MFFGGTKHLSEELVRGLAGEYGEVGDFDGRQFMKGFCFVSEYSSSSATLACGACPVRQTARHQASFTPPRPLPQSVTSLRGMPTRVCRFIAWSLIVFVFPCSCLHVFQHSRIRLQHAEW